MKTNYFKPTKTALAKVTREICENLYNEGGADKVYTYANKIKLLYHPCKACEADTPTISDLKGVNTCACCGQGKVEPEMTIKVTGGATLPEMVESLEKLLKSIKAGKKDVYTYTAMGAKMSFEDENIFAEISINEQK